jgi:hypothetical protein
MAGVFMAAVFAAAGRDQHVLDGVQHGPEVKPRRLNSLSSSEARSHQVAAAMPPNTGIGSGRLKPQVGGNELRQQGSTRHNPSASRPVGAAPPGFAVAHGNARNSSLTTKKPPGTSPAAFAFRRDRRLRTGSGCQPWWRGCSRRGSRCSGRRSTKSRTCRCRCPTSARTSSRPSRSPRSSGHGTRHC